MKNRLKFAFFGLALLLSVQAVSAQEFERIPAAEESLYGSRVYVSGDYETMRNIRNYWQREAYRLRTLRGAEFALCGSGDAIFKVSIPMRLLYAQNDTTLSVYADAMLRPFLQYVRGDNPLTSVVVACHSDDNGSPRYLTAMTTARARSVERWMRRQGVRTAGVYYYGMAGDSPRSGNDSLAGRERNRRVTLYFVPSKEMLKLAKKNKLNTVK